MHSKPLKRVMDSTSALLEGDPQTRRVRMMLLIGSAALIFMGTTWLAYFGSQSSWASMSLDVSLVATGIGTIALVRLGRVRVAALWLYATLIFALCYICIFMDVPSAGAPRSIHHFFLALAVSSFTVFRNEPPWLRHSVMGTCMVAFFVFASVTHFGSLSGSGLPDAVRVPGTWLNNLAAVLIFYVLLHIMQNDVAQRSVLENDLRKALTLRQFQLHLQPQVTDSGKVVGAEALVRWSHPVRGLVAPNDFITLAEQTGLIVPLGNQVLEMACMQLVEWARSPETANLTLSVNVSAQQFSQANFVGVVQAVIERTGAVRSRLKIELTESMLVDDIEGIIAKMHALKAVGVGFSLDDFGTGYSSLNYLKRLPLDQLKIDKSFVNDVLTNASDAAIARTVLWLGNNLGFAVIAEGVETEGQKAFLTQHGCHAFQGYLFSRPLSAEDFKAFVSRPELGLG